MRRLEIYFGDALTSLFANMLFPDDASLAKGYVANRICRGPLPLAKSDGLDFSDHEIDHYRTIGAWRTTETEIDNRMRGGTIAGEVTKSLWSLICTKPNMAGWNNAIKAVENHYGRIKEPGSRSQIRIELARFSPVIHYWGAWNTYGQRLPREYEEIEKLVLDAHALLMALREWRDSHPQKLRAQHSYLSVEDVKPWAGINDPGVYSFPYLGELPPILLDDLKAPGRPRKPSPKLSG